MTDIVERLRARAAAERRVLGNRIPGCGLEDEAAGVIERANALLAENQETIEQQRRFIDALVAELCRAQSLCDELASQIADHPSMVVMPEDFTREIVEVANASAASKDGDKP
jgi:uncharacterized coiled-coil protein SlyX